MIGTVEVLLCRWGRWAASGRSSGLGYPKQSAFMRDAGVSTRDYGPYLDSEVLAVDAAVSAMPLDLRLVCIETYVQGGSKRAVAARMHIGKTKFYEVLDQAQAYVVASLYEQGNDRHPRTVLI